MAQFGILKQLILITTIYDALGRGYAHVDALGYRTTALYVISGQSVAQQDALGYLTTRVYDQLGRGYAHVEALGYRNTMLFDIAGQMIASQDALGYLSTSFYDSNGRPTARQNALGYISTTNFDAAGRSVSMQDATGSLYTTIYDALGQSIAYLNPLGNRFSFVYDGAGQQTVTINPLNQRSTSTFDVRGQLASVLDPKGQLVTHSYSARYEEIGRVYADGTRVTSAYDPRGLQTSVQDHTGNYTKSYDGNGRLSVWNAPGHQNSQPLTNTYDPNGNRTKLATWWGPLSWMYDPRNQATNVMDPGYSPTSIVGAITTWTFDPRGQVIRQDNYDATHTTVTYDANGQVLQMDHRTNAGALVDRAWYQYDVDSRPTSKLTADGTSLFGYDATNRLTSENNPVAGLLSWTYDVAGRRTTAQDNMGIGTYGYDVGNQLLTVTDHSGLTTNSYDANGNTSLAQGPTGSPTSYTWDPANRMTQALLPNGDLNTNQYRHDNMRSKNTKPAGSQVFIWDGDGLPGLLGAIGSGSMASHLAVRGPNLSRMVGQYTAGGGAMVAQFHLDRQSSVQAITRLLSGSPVTDIRYKLDAWGNVISGAIAGNNYVYIGGEGYWLDTDLIKQYVRDRWLDNEMGRWLSRDPISFADRFTGGYIYLGSGLLTNGQAPPL